MGTGHCSLPLQHIFFYSFRSNLPQKWDFHLTQPRDTVTLWLNTMMSLSLIISHRCEKDFFSMVIWVTAYKNITAFVFAWHYWPIINVWLLIVLCCMYIHQPMIFPFWEINNFNSIWLTSVMASQNLMESELLIWMSLIILSSNSENFVLQVTAYRLRLYFFAIIFENKTQINSIQIKRRQLKNKRQINLIGCVVFDID